MKITFFYRRPLHIGHYSIEFLFDTVRQHLPASMVTHKVQTRHFSTGILPRLRIVRECARQQGEINHITGDIHFVALALPGKNTILTIHDLGFLHNGNPLAKWLYQWFWVKLPAKRVAAITVVSEATRQHLLRVVNIPERKIRVIGNFISPDYHPVPKGFHKECPVILHIGCAPNKNIARLAQALEGIPCKLVVVGNLLPADRLQLEQSGIHYELKSKLSHEEIRQEYAQCDMVAFVSLLEGFGLPILEAQTTGRVVITSNLSAMPEVAGEGALLVNPYQVEDIRRVILTLIENEALRNQLIQKGFENVKRFSIEKVTEQYVTLYREIAEGNILASS